jgi:hypothetical protein
MNTVAARVSSLPEGFYGVFAASNLETQKLVNLIAIMNTGSRFFDFIYAVYREKLITGDTFLTDADIRVFLGNRESGHDRQNHLLFSQSMR